MKKINAVATFGVSAMALVVATNTHAAMTVDLTLADYTSYAENSSSFDSTVTYTVNGQPTITSVINGNDLIGLYNFNVSPINAQSSITPIPPSIWSTCVSPAGLLQTGTYAYTLDTFAQAQPGLNPTAWAGANNVNGGYGIQNANYLFNYYSTLLIASGNTGIAGQFGSVKDQGAALALAMYDALYNSTDYSKLGGAAFQFTGNFLTSGSNVAKDYGLDITRLLSASFNPVTGAVLVPNNPNVSGPSGQDQLFVLAGAEASSVPEPSTIFTGALLLLPFGVSALRILRKNRGA